MISRVFPATHPRRGEETHFMSKILLNFDQVVVQDGEDQFPSKPGYTSKYAAAIVKDMGFEPKITTIRENYDLWSRRAEKINRGEAVLSLRQWSGSPYRSKQVEFMRLEKIGVQKVSIQRIPIESGAKQKFMSIVAGGITVPMPIVAKNDGLREEDFWNWFKKDMEGVVIHFSDFKY